MDEHQVHMDVAVLKTEMKAMQKQLSALNDTLRWLNRIMFAGFFGLALKIVFEVNLL